ncbi:lamina-associated polypeptide 2-like [Xenopus laevis]|uniref:Lamina-associated polypeptide 2-like n=2 Tax=Xenopus laevis TaxID=8355 RepID=A0A8J1LAY7_XENLA|nr:lamina-associated polypeptide 2-like [Xenopus laevis]XP_041426693.1 lamina-associated polypeptide 2-like [Xenopus laevis]XP_041430686.1 lamina-associated polypeptide 2-like [Xenopus laevis]
MSSRRSRSAASGSPHHRHSDRRRDDDRGREKSCRKECIFCSLPALQDKKVCQSCFDQNNTSQSSEQFNNFMSWMKDSFNKSMSDMVEKVTDNVLAKVSANQPSTSYATADLAVHIPDDSVSSDSQEEGEVDSDDELFNTSFIEPLILAMRKTLNLDVPCEPSSQPDLMFKSSKKSSVFHIHDVVKATIKSEWDVPDKRFFLSKRMKKMYPFPEDQVKQWVLPPKVDASITRVARRTTLPVDEGVSLKDPMERRQDSILKKAYSVSGSICKPCVAITSLARANKIWLNNVVEALQQKVSREEILNSLHEIQLVNDFCAEASMDILKLAAKDMSLVVAARRSLWLRHWFADTPSKHNLCSLPFEGDLLFGPKLENIISKASAGKSAFLPQDKKERRTTFRGNRPSFKDVKAYRPGRNFQRQSWKTKPQPFQVKKDSKPDRNKSF